MLTDNNVREIENIFTKVRDGEVKSAAIDLNKSSVAKRFPPALIDGFCQGLRTGTWTHLDELFLDRAFINGDGLLFWMAPYRQLRNGVRARAISGIFGLAPMLDGYTEIREIATSLFGGSFHAAAEVIGFRRFASFGMAGGSAGEAFLVPNNWEIGNVADGPALNDMTEQFARIRRSEPMVRRLLDGQSADLILGPVLDTVSGASTQNLEFQYHEVAHGIGLGFAQKYRMGAFKSFHNCAVEEWRSDGVSFSLMANLLGDEAQGKLIAANLALRLSVDAIRAGGVDADHDAHATALALQDMLDSGAAEIQQGRLRFLASDHTELAQAVNQQRVRARQTTFGEIECGADIGRLTALYRTIVLREDTANQLRLFLAS